MNADIINDELAEEIVQLARDVHTQQPSEIVLIDPTMPAEHPVQFLSPDLARAVARRLNALAEQFEPPRTLRRLQIVDEEFREREGGV
ncbi:hypothetical protein [Microbacterium sp. XT11]|uniref:hypothetical protein n=1 Tax=Microbacterium sp. XT11 TaxID=367477 RepID=UPI00082D3663|nr:hypothetical protein [Microbacterium sp. XT11]